MNVTPIVRSNRRPDRSLPWSLVRRMHLQGLIGQIGLSTALVRIQKCLTPQNRCLSQRKRIEVERDFPTALGPVQPRARFRQRMTLWPKCILIGQCPQDKGWRRNWKSDSKEMEHPHAAGLPHVLHHLHRETLVLVSEATNQKIST